MTTTDRQQAEQFVNDALTLVGGDEAIVLAALVERSGIGPVLNALARHVRKEGDELAEEYKSDESMDAIVDAYQNTADALEAVERSEAMEIVAEWDRG